MLSLYRKLALYSYRKVNYTYLSNEIDYTASMSAWAAQPIASCDPLRRKVITRPMLDNLLRISWPKLRKARRIEWKIEEDEADEVYI